MNQRENILINSIKNKKILFITTKNLNYIRIAQEINIIKDNAADTTIIGSYKMNYFSRLIYVFFKLLFLDTKNYDVVFIGHAAQLVVPFFKHKFKNNFTIIDFFISLYDTGCFDRKYFKPDSIIGKILYQIDKSTIHFGQLIISDTLAHRDYFSKEFSVDKDKIITIYIKASINKALLNQLNKMDGATRDISSFHVLYFGSILPLQGVDTILSAINLIKHENIHFTVIGPINKHISALAPAGDNITYINWLSEEELYKYISTADLCLAGHFNNQIAKASRTIPGKAYIYQALNKPIILGDNPANHELFSSLNPDIYFVPMGDSLKLAKLIHSIYLKHIHQTDT